MALETASRVPKALGVQLNLRKTRIVHVRRGFDFLGHKIKRDSRPSGNHCAGRDGPEHLPAVMTVPAFASDAYRV